MTTQVNGTTGITFSDSSVQNTAAIGFRNRIINGAMMIDQRNAGASVTPTNGAYTLDRWSAILTQASKYSVRQNAGSVANGGSVVAPTGFTNWLGATSSSAYSVLTGDLFAVRQLVEGFNVADLGWGAAGASTVTLSFWVRSSLTGTFGGSLINSAANRFYPFTYTISAANTWEQKSVTIAGDTSGTWVTDNGIGLGVYFGLGGGATYSGTAGAWTGTGTPYTATGAVSVVGTSGATFYITGVQLERGTTASSFDFRSYGDELMLCQRYYYTNVGSTAIMSGLPASGTDTYRQAAPFFPVPMRASPTISAVWNTGTGQGNQYIGVQSFQTYTNISSTSGQASLNSFTASSEL